MASFWSAIAFADVDLPAPLTWGVVKGVLLRNFRWWAKHPTIFTDDGVLTIGYTYPNMFMSDNYNSPGSPYWAMLSFACLAVPEDHPFWKVEEEPYPLEKIKAIVGLKHPLHINSHLGGHTFLLSSGQSCLYPLRATEAKYGKFAYSSAFGYSVPTGSYHLESVVPESTLALSDDDGEMWKVRRKSTKAELRHRDGRPYLASQWKPWPDVEIDTFLLPPTDTASNWHLRVHKLTTGRRLQTAEGAFALYGRREPDGRELSVLDETSSQGVREAANEALAVSRGGVVGIIEVLGQTQRQGKVLQMDPNSNLNDSRTMCPLLLADLEAGMTVCFTSAVFAVPESVKGWEDSWRAGYESRLEVPTWVLEEKA